MENLIKMLIFVTHHMDSPFQASLSQVRNQPLLAYYLYGSLYFISSAVIIIVSTCKPLFLIIFTCSTIAMYDCIRSVGLNEMSLTSLFIMIY